MSDKVKFLLAAVALLVSPGIVVAQTMPTTAPKQRATMPSAPLGGTSAADQTRLRDSLKQCLADWDKETHIDRKRWAVICQEKFRAAEKASREDKAKAAAELAKIKAKSTAPKPNSQ